MMPFDRFTERAQDVIARSQEILLRYGHNQIDTEHILLALPKSVPHTACVDARDLKTHIGDSVHFDTAAQNEIGKRFAAEAAKLERR